MNTDPQTLGGTSVLFNGQRAALLYVSAGQINAIMPIGLQSSISVQIQKNGATIGTYSLGAVNPAPNPGIFRNSDGTTAVLNQDGTLNTQTNPAHAGSTISFWGTGIPAIEYESNGGVPSQVTNVAPNLDLAVEMQSLGTRLNIAYAGAAPGLVGGIFQINVVVPGGEQGDLSLVVVSDGARSQPIAVYVEP